MHGAARHAKRSYPWLTLVTLCVIVLVPRATGAGAATIAGLLFGGALALIGLSSDTRTPHRGLNEFAVAAFICLLWFGTTSALSDSPLISLTGAMGQHAGLALWLLGAVWLIAGAHLADAGTMRRTFRVVAVWGAVTSVAAIYEAVTFGSIRPQGFAGFFENSSSLGAVIAVGAVSALVWALSSATLRQRTAALVILATIAGGLYVSASRSALLGVLACLLGAWVMRSQPALRRNHPGALAAMACVVPAIVSFLLIAGSSGPSSSLTRSTLAQWVTHRDDVWRSAWAQFLQAPLLGSGLEQFSAFVSWDISPAGVAHRTTGDPHNLVLTLLLGGGVIGASLAAYATWTMLTALYSAAPSTRSWAADLAIAVPLVPIGLSLVGWVSPSAMIATAALTGSIIGSLRARADATETAKTAAARKMARGPLPKKKPPRTTLPKATVARWAGITIASSALMVSTLGFKMLPVQYAFAATTMDVDGLISAYRAWPEPAIIVAAARVTSARLASAPGRDAVGESLLALASRDTSWRADVAAAGLTLAQYLEANEPSKYPRLESIAKAGAAADPMSGYWYVFASHEASRLALHAQATAMARSALAYELTAGSHARMTQLSAGQTITQK